MLDIGRDNLAARAWIELGRILEVWDNNVALLSEFSFFLLLVRRIERVGAMTFRWSVKLIADWCYISRNETSHLDIFLASSRLIFILIFIAFVQVLIRCCIFCGWRTNQWIYPLAAAIFVVLRRLHHNVIDFDIATLIGHKGSPAERG